MSASVSGVGGSIGGISSSKTIVYDVADLPLVLVEACKKEKKGLFVSIDEVQKVSLGDMSSICNAFQMASRKGHNVILAIAGLPDAFEQIIREEGCAYMRRDSHEELSLLTREETRSAFETAFASIDGLTLPTEALDLLVSDSMGHPYMIQLLGYYLIATINEQPSQKSHTVSLDEVRRVCAMALETYESRALQPMMDELSASECDYLRAMVAVLDRHHVADTAKVAAQLGKNPSSLTRVRGSLLRNGIIVAPKRGSVRFAIPYLRMYVRKGPRESAVAQIVESWDV
jgi:hypothetical protein